MLKTKTRIYIDGANLYQWIKAENVDLDYGKFYTYLKNKHHPEIIYIFLWRIKANEPLYKSLKMYWYTVIFKDTFENEAWEIKWNVDSEIVLKTVEEFYEDNYDCWILISWDWDFSCLIDFWQRKKIIPKILAPNSNNCSYFLRRHKISLTYLNNPFILTKIKRDPL